MTDDKHTAHDKAALPTVITDKPAAHPIVTGENRELWGLLAKQAALYTKGDSGSMPRETAQELLESVRYTLECGEYAADKAENTELAFKRGQAIIKQRVDRCARLLLAASRSLPYVPSACMSATLRAVGTFIKGYDWQYMAHFLPRDIDYPLCLPVSHQLRGIDYALAYMESFTAENRLLALFGGAQVRSAARAVCPDYIHVPVNICEIALFSAAGAWLVRSSAESLRCDAEELAVLHGIFENLTEDDIAETLYNAGYSAVCSRGVSRGHYAEYAALTVQGAAARVAAARDTGSLEGVFPIVK